MNIKHNKLRNTGILFELLVRKVAADVLDGKSDSFAVKLMREHFHSKSELGKELQLYRTFFNTTKLSENKALDMLNIILQRRKTLNEKLLNAQKFLLIKEIKQQCDLKQFMAGRVPSYKVYASVYKLFETTNRSETDSSMFMQIDEMVSARFVVVEHLKGELKEEKIIKESTYSEVLKKQPEEIRYLSYKFLLERFNEKYSNFSDKQKTLLREYINNGTDLEKFKNYVAEEAKALTRQIQRNSHKIKNDVTKIKITSSIDAFNVLQTQFEEMVDTREEFRALYISRANEVICCNLISIGDESHCIVSVQEIIRGALMCKAQGIILAHNHPSGATNPSEADKRITKQIKQAAELFNILVLDHLILSRNSYHSFSDEGEL